ncbi:hypothetical protein N8035_02310 [Algibacter sp.]|nr:hypothetical protein [Algibacter sp.]
MKPKTLLALVLFAFILSCSTDKKKNSLEEDNLKGNVKSVREFSFVAVDKLGEISKGARKTQIYKKYDDKGNRIEQDDYGSDGSLEYRYTFKYDDKGNEIERNRHKSDWIVDCEYTYKYELDTKNNWIKRIDFKNDKPQYILEREIEYY